MRFTALSAAALVAASPAFAGGFSPVVVAPAPVVAPVIVPPAPSMDWSGFYVGAQVGKGSFEHTLTYLGEESPFVEGDGTLYGIHAGYQRDFGRLVAGVELAYDMASIDIESSEGNPELEPGVGLGELSSVTRAGVRLGFDAGRFLPYVTAGLASASFDWNELVGDAVEDSTSGSYYGIGAEFAVSERFSVGVEALRHNFDGPEVAAFEGSDAESTLDTVALRASYRF